MFIYNVTVNISEDIHQEWVRYMKEEHMAEVMRSGCFVDCQLLKVLYVQDEGHTYSAQYRFLEMGDIERYQAKFAPALQADHRKKFGEKATAFRTLLEIL